MNAARQAVIFDWNGTLLNDAQYLLDATNVVMTYYGLPTVSLSYYQEIYTVPIKEMYRKLGCSEEILSKRSDELVGVYMKEFSRLSETVLARRRAGEMLNALKKQERKIAILSNYTTREIVTTSKRLELDGYFDAILANDPEDGAAPFHKKGKGDRLRGFLQEQSIQRAFIVGDTVEEIEIAREHGHLSIVITNGTCTREKLEAGKPDFLIEDLGEIPTIVEKVFG
jgi:phosphoglycolate phosphatase